MILAGRGCLDARSEVLQLAERVGGVIIKPSLGTAVVPDNDAFTTGGIGLLGTAPSQEAMKVTRNHKHLAPPRTMGAWLHHRDERAAQASQAFSRVSVFWCDAAKPVKEL